MKISLALLLFVGFGCDYQEEIQPAPSSHAPIAINPVSSPDLGPGVTDLGPGVTDLGPGVTDACGGANPVTCTAADACHAAGVCDPASGQCSSPALADGTACPLASGGGSCVAGVCTVASCDAGHADCNGDASDGCEAEGSGTVDQAQLQCPGWNLVLSPSQEPIGQTFVAGATGRLTGIEVGLHRCGQDDPTAIVQLAVSDSLGNVIATASVPVAQLDGNCVGSGLDANSVTAAFFDLTASCAQVTAAEALSLSMTLDQVSASTCDPTTYTCTGSGNYCDFDEDCQINLRADVGSEDYTAGTGTVRGANFGYDLAFKTFVR